MMTVMSNVGRYDWTTWLMGLFRAGIGGASGALTGILGPMATHPENFNFGAGLRSTMISMIIGFCIGGVVSMATFLQTHTGPESVIVKTTESTVSATPTGTKVVAVETTQVLPPQPPKEPSKP